jgi:hypothetical protein
MVFFFFFFSCLFRVMLPKDLFCSCRDVTTSVYITIPLFQPMRDCRFGFNLSLHASSSLGLAGWFSMKQIKD